MACSAGPKPYVRLKLIGGGHVDIDDEIPATRGDCPPQRPCGHVRCEHHLWTIAGVDNRPCGRGKLRQPTTLYPGWADWPPAPSCELDVSESVRPGDVGDLQTIAHALNKTLDWTQKLLQRAIQKCKANGEDPR